MANRECEFGKLTQEFHEALFPALKFVARKCGYALLVHGSLKTDIDLVAVPWRNGAINQEALAEKIRETVESIIGFAESREEDKNPTIKPNGRLAWSFWLVPQNVRGPYIDLSIMPTKR